MHYTALCEEFIEGAGVAAQKAEALRFDALPATISICCADSGPAGYLSLILSGMVHNCFDNASAGPPTTSCPMPPPF